MIYVRMRRRFGDSHNNTSGDASERSAVPVLRHVPKPLIPVGFIGATGLSPLVTAWEVTACRFSFSNSINRCCSAISASIFAQLIGRGTRLSVADHPSAEADADRSKITRAYCRVAHPGGTCDHLFKEIAST